MILSRRSFARATISALIGLQFLRPLEFVTTPLTETQIIALELKRIMKFIPTLYDMDDKIYSLINNSKNTKS